jgi:hypothetical protein
MDSHPGRCLRLFHCRPVRAAFDQLLRDVMIPDLWRQPGIERILAGRRGPDETGDRLVASVWSSLADMHAAMGEDIERSRFHPEYLPETTDRRLEVLPVVVALGAGSPPPGGVLRLARGRLRSTEVDAYAVDVRDGFARDLVHGHGPHSLVLARLSPREFVTLSAWVDWERIERATGASVDQPVHTQREHELDAFSAEHYELVPTLMAD